MVMLIRGAGKNRDQPHEPEYCDQTSKPKTGSPVWGENPGRRIVPMPGHPWPQTVSFAWRAKPRSEAGFEERKFQERRLDGRGDRGAKVASFARAVICQAHGREMMKKPQNPLVTNSEPRR